MLLPEPLLHLSAFFEANRQAYYDHLPGVSQRGAWEARVLQAVDLLFERPILTIFQAQAALRSTFQPRTGLSSSSFRPEFSPRSPARLATGCSAPTPYYSRSRSHWNRIDNYCSEEALQLDQDQGGACSVPTCAVKRVGEAISTSWSSSTKRLRCSS